LFGYVQAFEGKCLVLPAGVPEELKHDNVIRFDDALTGCEVSVWWRPLFSDAEVCQLIHFDDTIVMCFYHFGGMSAKQASGFANLFVCVHVI